MGCSEVKMSGNVRVGRLGYTLIRSSVFVIFLIIMIYNAISYGQIPGLNLINSAVYLVAGLLFIPSLTQSARTMALTDLRKTGISEYFVLSRKDTNNKNGNNYTWAGINSKCYRIAFYGLEQGKKNCDEVLKTMKSTPRIIWVRPGTWGVIVIAIFLEDVLSYNGFVSAFGTIGMSDTAFGYVSKITFYLPSVLAFICPVLSFVFVKVRDNILYECAVRLAADIDAAEHAGNESGNKQYQNICPVCGAKSSSSLKHCSSCGSSFE